MGSLLAHYRAVHKMFSIVTIQLPKLLLALETICLARLYLFKFSTIFIEGKL